MRFHCPSICSVTQTHVSYILYIAAKIHFISDFWYSGLCTPHWLNHDPQSEAFVWRQNQNFVHSSANTVSFFTLSVELCMYSFSMSPCKASVIFCFMCKVLYGYFVLPPSKIGLCLHLCVLILMLVKHTSLHDTTEPVSPLCLWQRTVWGNRHLSYSHIVIFTLQRVIKWAARNLRIACYLK